MAETYLNLLNSAAAVSAKVYEQIDSSMTQRLNIEAQAGKFQVDAMQKAAQFAETQRMNDEQIMNMRAGNYLQAQKLEVDRMLMPIKMETANLQLESQRLALQRAKEQEGKNHFNSLTSMYDDQIGYALLETESPEMAQEYIGYKAQVSDYVAKGGKFDPISFEESLKTIRSKYAKTRPSSIEQVEYNPQTSYLLGQVSPKLQTEYDKRHPLVQGSRNSMAISIYDTDDKEISKYEKYRGLYTNEEWGQLSVGRDTMQNNNRRIEQWNKTLDSLGLAKARAMTDPATDPKSIVGYDSQIETYQGYVRDATAINSKLYKDAASGKYGYQSPEVPVVSPKPAGGAAGGITPPFKPGQPIGGLENPRFPETNPTGKQQYQGIQDTLRALSDLDEKGNSITPYEASELQDVDFSYWQKSGTGDEPAYSSKIGMKSRIENSIDSMARRYGGVEGVATREKIEKLFGTLNRDYKIPIDEEVAKIIQTEAMFGGRKSKHPAVSSSFLTKDQQEALDKDAVTTISFGPKDTGMTDFRTSIQSADELFDIVNKIKSPGLKEEVLKDLYASLIVASNSSGLTNKDK